ncbi:MAG TPA: alpha/beta fold hydrolase [Streptosporangiaceae bacterium]|jgi:dipeptidyl aminopeptidase/acylaminoacyl peptidase
MRANLQRLLGVAVYRAFDVGDDGRILAGSDESGSTQLIEIAPDGTARTLTALGDGCTGTYMPGEHTVIVSHDAAGNEQHQISRLPDRDPAAGPATDDDLIPLVRDPRYMHQLAATAPGRICYFTNRRDGVSFDPVIRDLATGEERTLSLGDRSYDEAAPSPDGRWLALTVRSPTVANAEHLVLVDLVGEPGAEKVIEVTPEGDPSMNCNLCWLPDSSTLLVTSNTGREFTAVARYRLADADWSWLIADDSADLAGWVSPDGATILVERNENGASVLWMHDAESGARRTPVTLPATGCIVDNKLPPPAWAPDSSTVTFSITGATAPGDVLVADAATGSVRQLTSSAAGLGDLATSVPEEHVLPAGDGEPIPCLVYRPTADGDPALAGSAVLLVHGGPEAQAKQNFTPYVQALAQAGHTVLVPNVRGSVGYGKRWYSLDDVGLRLDSVADLAAIHAYLPELGLDQSRAALWGGSYGGYMVLAGLAFQPELWAAGVDIVGISSLVTFLENTSAYRRAYREREYGTLARDREFLHAASPLTRIDDMRAPLFIIHGANDPRVPLSEAEQIHAELTSRGQECELLVYGDEGHGLAKRQNRSDAVPRALDFLARHLARR